MRFRFLALALVPLALTACGGGDNAPAVPDQSTSSQKTASSPTAAAPEQPSSSAAPRQTAGGALVMPAIKLKTPSGKAPAVVLLPDTDNRAAADSEAKKLARLGIASVVVASPTHVPDDPSAFNKAVTQVGLAIALLKKSDTVDPHRIGIIGEGVGAHVGAVAIGRDPQTVAAAALADIGGSVVPSSRFAPERWLKRATGIQLLFQRDQAERAMTAAEARRLVLASPPGTIMEQYDDLGTQAEAARDSWMKMKLLSV